MWIFRPDSTFFSQGSLGKPQKFFFLVARPLRGGGGDKAWPLRKKNFYRSSKKNTKKIPLSGRATKKRTFFAASLTVKTNVICCRFKILNILVKILCIVYVEITKHRDAVDVLRNLVAWHRI